MNEYAGSFAMIDGNGIAFIFISELLGNENNNIISQIETFSKRLKRADYNQVVLVIEDIDENKKNMITNIIKYFEEEDVIVLAVITDKIAKAAMDNLEQKFIYGIAYNDAGLYDDPKTLSYIKKGGNYGRKY